MLRNSSFIPEIEGLRGVLSLVVIAAHVYAPTMFWGWGCMEIFFVISGFLIGRQILCYYTQPGFVKKYLIRRAIRIWPAYYFFLLLSIVANATWDALKYGDPWHKLTWLQIVIPMFFLQNSSKYFTEESVQNLTYNDVPYHFGHSWSVAIEEHFYLIAPIVLIALYKRTRSPAVWGLVVLLGTLISVVFRIDHSYWLIVGRLDGFLVGVFVAYVWTQKAAATYVNISDKTLNVTLAVCAVYSTVIIGHYVYIGFAVGFDDGLYGRVFDFGDPITLFLLNPYVGFALLGGCLVYCSALNVNTLFLAPLRMKVFQYLGRISYSTYLCHVLIVSDLVPRLLGTHGTDDITVWNYVFSYALTIGFSHLSYIYVETRLMRYKRKLAY